MPPRANVSCGANVTQKISDCYDLALFAWFPLARCPASNPTLFRKAFHIKGNDDLRWVSLTYTLQVF